MKKALLILASLIIAVATVSLTTSCKKDIEKAKSLIGTSWTGQSGLNVYTINFKSQFDFEMYVDGTGHYHYSGSFIIAGDTISLTYNSGDWDSDWKSGKFLDDNRMEINHIVFTRVQ